MEVNVVGEKTKEKNLGSDIVYYVLEGKGTFFVGNEEYSVEKGDVVFIPKGTCYKDTKGLKVLSVSVPKFDLAKHISC